MNLTQKKCIPCETGVAPFTAEQAAEMMKEVPLWTLTLDSKSILREFSFEDFAEAMVFANEIAAIAENEGHHPDLLIKCGSVSVTLATHSIGGLSENDFILAAKIDEAHMRGSRE